MSEGPSRLLLIEARVAAVGAFLWEGYRMHAWWKQLGPRATALTVAYLVEVVLLCAFVAAVICLSRSRGAYCAAYAAAGALLAISFFGGFSIGGSVLPGAVILLGALIVAGLQAQISFARGAVCAVAGSVAQAAVMFGVLALR